MIYYEFKLFGRLLIPSALVLDPADGELSADTGVKVQPFIRKGYRLVEAALSDKEQPVLRMGASVASLRLHRPLEGGLGSLPVVLEQHEPAAEDGLRPLEIGAELEREVHLATHRFGELRTRQMRDPAESGSHPGVRFGKVRVELDRPGRTAPPPPGTGYGRRARRRAGIDRRRRDGPNDARAG